MYKYETDKFMRNLWLVMLRDFRTTFGPDYGSRHQRFITDGDFVSFRKSPWPGRSRVSPYLFKAEYQLENLFKRYRFEKDAFTDDELNMLSRDKFLDTQVRLNQPLQLSATVLRVLQRARAHARTILGQFDEEEHLSSCRFGKRACVGTPYGESYLDCKVEHITGSTDQIKWLREKLLPSDPLLKEALGGADKTVICDTLKLTFVPKSYKALRAIMPDTLVGTLYSSGIGKIIQTRLKRAGLDIRYLQKTHRIKARKYSVSRICATADLSAASDSITTELLRWILPGKWFHKILYGRIPYVQVGDMRIRMNTVMTMGLGFTFPLQTLIFYCLLKAVAELVGAPWKQVSVYGDDLIYPSQMHKYVVHIFNKLNLLLNEDKTYVQDSFRESCGGDYYRGCDVRPYQPEGRASRLSRRAYGTLLYRSYNGLRRRWDLEDLPQTFEWLEAEIALTQEEVFQVPPSFPDDAGLKVSKPSNKYLYSPVIWDAFKQQWVFNYLHWNPDHRVVKTQFPYYWECLRSHAEKEPLIDYSFGDVTDLQVLKWVRARKSPLTVKTESGEKLRRLLPCVARKGSAKLVSCKGSTSRWI